MNAPSYNYGALTGIDYNSIDYNSLLKYYMAMNQNVNFKGSQDVSQTQPVNPYLTSNSAIPVTNSQTNQSSGGFGFIEGALATALIGGGALLLLKGRKAGGIGNAIKSLLSRGNIGGKSKLSKLTAIKTKEGIRFLQPGKTEVINKPEIASFLENNGIIFTNAEKEFKAGVSKLTNFEFGSYKIKIKDGEIVEIVKGTSSTNILENLKKAKATSPDGKDYKSIKEIIAELGKTSDADLTILGNAKNIRYTNVSGDNTLALSVTKYGDKAELEELTALKRFKFEDPEIQALKLNISEKAFAKEDFWKDEKIGKNFVIGNYNCEINGETCILKGNKLL